ncbi:efflux RND transporter permease subunit [candidate division KSB1 bacterium]|nr:efflux RND transporter permease subunit [candidate division KSB1 bacterium]
MTMTQMAIKRGVTFGMIYLIAIGFGLFSLIRLKLDLFPKLEFPMIAIITQYSGVGPFDIETVVTRPIEETVASVQNVKKVSSTSSQGLSAIMLEFDWGTDMNQAEIDVRNSLQFIEGYLPEDISKPIVFAFDPSQQPIIFMALKSNLHGQAELRHISEYDLEPRLERIPGVASSFTMGGMRREISVFVDPNKLRAHNVTLDQVSAALQMNNLQLPAGLIENSNQEFTIRAAGEYTSVDQIANTSVANYNGSIIHVKDVASVVDGFVDQRQKVWNNDTSAVAVMVQKQSDANTVEVCDAVNGRMAQIQSELPRGITISTIYDQSMFINRSMSNLGMTAIQAILLTLLVLLFFLRELRSSLIVSASIPVSMIVTFAVMDQAGITLNVISMAGLALAVGMLVDNSIVVLESIFRRREDGEEIREAALNGTKEVGMAVTASTLTTLAVFVPVLFVPGLAGQIFKDMIITICFSLSISLIVSLTLIPLLASRLLTFRAKRQKPTRLHTIGEQFQKVLNGLQSVTDKSLNWALEHRWLTISGTFICFFLAVFSLFMMGGDFLPETDDGFIAIAVDRSTGTSLESMEESMHQVNRILKENMPEAETIYANFGQGEGIMAMFSSRASNEGDITIRLSKRSNRNRSKFEIQDVLRDKLNTLPDVKAKFEDRGAAMFMGGSDIMIEVIGHDLDVAKALAEEVLEKVKNLPGVSNAELSIREQAPELKINFDRQRIADLGMSTAQVSRIISTAILGSPVTQYREGGDEFDVRVRLLKESRQSKSDIENIMIMTPMGRQIPLRAVAAVEYSRAPIEINREDQERIISVNIDISGRDLRRATADVEAAIHGIVVPNDFRVQVGGTAEDQQESFIYLGLAMVVAIMLTYMVMAAQFESFLHPFIILFTIPFSFIGVALGLGLTGTNVNVMALIGVIMLVGIVVNNGIVLVDYTNQLRERGRIIVEALKEASHVRLRPVLMTALTTIFGMLPLALGVGESGENWAPMARSVMGGLAVATVLTLIVVPVLYLILETWAEKIRNFFRGRRAVPVKNLTIENS